MIGWNLRNIIFIILLCALLSSSACQKKTFPLTEASASPQELANRFLKALEQKSEAGLWSLRVIEKEYKEIVWPPYEKMGHEPAGRPWAINYLDARKSINRALSDYGGRKLKLVRVYFAKGQDKQVGTFKIWRDCRIVVRNENGEEEELDYINTVIEMDGSYKVVAYHS